jgi:hypothetical protein
MARGETDYATNAALRLRNQQGRILVDFSRRLRQQGSKIVIKHKCAGIGGITDAPGAFVAGAQVTSRIIFWQGLSGPFLHLPQPGTFGAVGRNQHPFTRERI